MELELKELEQAISELKKASEKFVAELNTQMESVRIAISNLKKLPSPTITDELENLVIYLNAGHGGLRPDGSYATFPGHGKMYEFTNQKGEVYYRSYEGETNRIFAGLIEKELLARGATVIKTYFPVEDRWNVGINGRTNFANAEFLKRKSDGKKHLWLSFHSNAVGMILRGPSVDARGICIYTFPGHSPADTFTTKWYEELEKNLLSLGVTFRKEMSDGDPDYEANFEELRETAMPAILIENLFFTNIQDAKLLKNTEYQSRFVDATLRTLIWYAQNNVV